MNQCQFCGKECSYQVFALPDGRICCAECAIKLQRGELSADPNVIILSKDDYKIEDVK